MRKLSFKQKVVLKVLRRFSHAGVLRLRWVDGEIYYLGLGELLASETSGQDVVAEIDLVRLDFFDRLFWSGNIGLGESYMLGDWETAEISKVIRWFIINIAKEQGQTASSSKIKGVNFTRFFNRALHLLSPNSLMNSKKNIAKHYDLGNDFYSLWLDKTMTYSSAIFTQDDEGLEEAQFRKYDSLCQKLKLCASDHVLEIGCGWGGFCTFAAKRYGCQVTAITISKEQFNFTQKRIEKEGVSHLVKVFFQDYREIKGQFDKIASIEMLEAVGDKYLKNYFAKCHEVLKPDGLLAFQVITAPDSRYHNMKKGVDWIQKYIFPGSLLLSVQRINEVIHETGDLFMLGLEDIGDSYAKTLNHWHLAFNEKIDEVMGLGFDEVFVRKWNFYLKYCEAAFASRNISVIQTVYTRANNPNLQWYSEEKDA